METWPDRLMLMVEQLLVNPLISTLACEPGHILIYNDAAARLYGEKHPDALGRPLPEIFPDGWEALAPLYARAFAGESVRVVHEPLDTRGEGDAAADVFDAVLKPVRGKDGRIICVHMTGLEIGRRLRAESALRESEERQAFLLALSDALRPLTNPEDIAALAAARLGEVLGVSRVFYCDIANMIMRVQRDYTDGVPSIVGEYSLEAFGLEVLAGYQPGAIIKVNDVETDERIPERARSELLGRQVAAFVDIVLMKEGQQVGVLAVQNAEPRTWRPAEEILIREVGERVKLAIERARAETALRASEARFRALVTATSDSIYSLSPDWTLLRRLDGRGLLAAAPTPHTEWLETFIFPEDREHVWGAVQQAARTRSVYELEHRVRRLDGSVGWRHAKAVPLMNEAGEITEWFGVASDVTDRKIAEERLRRSEETLRLVTDNMPALLGFYDRELRYAYVNAEYGRFFGVSQEELLGRKMSEWLKPQAYARLEPYLQAALRGERVSFEDCEPDKYGPGQHGWTEETYIPHTGPDGAIDGLFAFIFDITNRKNAEAALRESEERLRQFGEASSDVLWIRDVDTLKWEYLSPAFATIYGLSQEEAIAGEGLNTWTDLILQEDRERAVACVQHIANGERVRFEYRILRPDGEIRWLRDAGFPIQGPDGGIVRIGGVSQDVTELKRTEAALRDEEARQRALVEGIPQLVWRSDNGGRWNWSGRQWREYTGQCEEDSRDWNWLNALHPDDRETAHQAWRQAQQEGLLQITCRIRQAATGEYRWFQVRAMPLRDEGRSTEWIGSCTDIDEQVRAREILMRAGEELERRVEERTAELMAAEATLRQAQKMEAVGQLTSGIAHDFNNMLQGISNNLELMRRRAEQGRLADAKRYVENARDTVNRAAALTHRLLAFARQQTLAPVPVNLDELVVGMTEMIRRTVGPSVQVEVRLADGNWPVLCDPSQLENALLNLCVNARDAMPNGGWLTILTNDVQLSEADLASESELTAGAYGTISVTDTGTGMSSEVLARVFEPFFTTKPLGQGTGLGLSQVYGFVRQSGGLVRIESAPDQGTTVRLFLPRHNAADEAQRDEAAAANAVLLVEDEAALRATTVEWLRDAGFRVLEAADGAAALRLLHGGGRVDILVTDVGLPGGMNGRQVAEAARAERPDLPVLFITGYAGTALRAALPEGMSVMDKPFALEELVTRIRAMLMATTV